MNRRKSTESIRLDKKRSKAVKQGMAIESDIAIPLPKHPLSRTEKTHLARAKFTLRAAQINAHKTESKRSKRTNTKDAISDSVPAHVHPEGERWIHVVQTQIQTKNRILRKQAQKTPQPHRKPRSPA